MIKSDLTKINQIGYTIVKIAFSVLAMLLMSQTRLYATHIRAGEITAERIDCAGLTFRITITAYTDLSGILFGGGELSFGDGNTLVIPNNIPNNTRLTRLPNGEYRSEPLDGTDLGDEVGVVQVVIEYTYGSSDRYNIGYRETNRNPGILNINNSIETSFFIETQVFVNPLLLCNNTPVLLIPPIDRACSGVAFFHNPGAFDPDGDSITYELVVPKRAMDSEVFGYRPVNDQSFYEDFERGDEERMSRPVFSIDPVTGQITWDAPGGVGEYNIAFVVKEFRKVKGEYFPLGFVTRDMQIIVEDCDNARPELIIPEDICVEAGTIIDATIFGIDSDDHDVKIDVFSQLLNMGATISPSDPSFQSSSPPAELKFRWETECIDVREKSYQVRFRITDNPPSGPKLVNIATWNITVIGPKPIFTTVDGSLQSISINWNSYDCQNAELLQLWRRVASNPYMPDSCETGIRQNAGYDLIAELPITAETYSDENLSAAAKYCYRLVALFPDPTNGESVVSDEVCFEFVPAEEPVITHVSVRRTDLSEGQIVVAWREPFELGNLTLPYIYKIERAEGLNNGNFIEVGSLIDSVGIMDSIGFIDSNINTQERVFTYRIGMINPTGFDPDEILYSDEASSVRIEPVTGFEQIALSWSADVPWSNTILPSSDNKHLVFRGLEGDTQEDFDLIAEVDVSRFGFNYIDSDVEDDVVYCYRILTKGTYGNPTIRSPLLNFSQVICVQTNDSIPPCAPIVTASGLTCEEFVAQQECSISDAVFQNTIIWSTSANGVCKGDIKEYHIFYTSNKGGQFNQIAIVQDTFFVHDLNDSFKGCYKVKAVDRSGNESEFGEEFCVDNCPNYVLPNVFTPDNADSSNDFFRPFGPESGVERCVRFVLEVKFEVYNRWGKKVYSYQGSRKSENEGIYINWDGINEQGDPLSSGVYYYLAEVTYDVVDPKKSVKQLKGWVQIFR